jgi:hypothetical protein
VGKFNIGFLKLCIHQLNQNLHLEFLTINLYSITIQIREAQEWVVVVEQRQQSEGDDVNRPMAAWEFIHSDNEIYLMILNK